MINNTVEQERHMNSIRKIEKLLNEKGIEYSVFGKYSPVCFTVNFGNKNEDGEIVTNTDNIALHLFVHNSTYTYIITDIYNTNGKNITGISESINNLNSCFEEDFKKYYIDKFGFICMQYTERGVSENYIVELISRYKYYFLETNLISAVFKNR